MFKYAHFLNITFENDPLKPENLDWEEEKNINQFLSLV